jgi:hypothetical protein
VTPACLTADEVARQEGKRILSDGAAESRSDRRVGKFQGISQDARQPVEGALELLPAQQRREMGAVWAAWRYLSS